MKQGCIVVLDDNRHVLSALGILLGRSFERCTLIDSPEVLLSTLREQSPDVLLLDMNFRSSLNTGNEGLYWLSEVKRAYPDLPVVLFTAYADVELAVEAMRRGAADFITKPWDNEALLSCLRQAMRQGSETQVAREAHSPGVTAGEVSWGRSEAMARVLDLVHRVAPTDANLLITGENGTGKEVIATYAHSLSLRQSRPMITVDMGAITESLFESELFGHVKGAFTDAKSDRLGKLACASGSTLFLDEIGNLAPALQAKLLVALERREVTRVGDNTPTPIDVRLISATNGHIFDMVRDGRFREDLLYRINTIHIHLPALRERPEDIEDLAQLFMRQSAERYGKHLDGLSPEALGKLMRHSWPGNIRELRHTIEKAVILAQHSVLLPEDLGIDHVRPQSSSWAEPTTPITLEAMERRLIAQSLERSGYNISASAEELGITRPTLYAKMKKYGL